MRLRMILLLAVGWCLMGRAADARNLTLAQAVELATDHANSIKAAEAEREAAREMLSAAKRDLLPVLSASVMASYVDYVPTLDIELPGMQPLSREFGSKEAYQTDLRLSLPVFTGGRTGATIDAAGAGRDYYAALADASEDEIVYRARVQYLEVLRAQEILKAAEASLERVRVLVNDVQARYVAGTADTVDMLEAELALTNAESQVTSAGIALQRSHISLLTGIGLPVTEEITLTDTLDDPSDSPAPAHILLDKPELSAARAVVNISDAQLKVRRAAFWPSLSVYGGYSCGKPNLDRFNNTWNDYFTFGAQATWTFNIGNKSGRERRAARYQLEASERQLHDVEERLQESARLAREGLRLARTRFASAQTERRIARENYRLAQESHREGALASNRLVEIEKSLTAAEASLAAARVDYYIAESMLLYAIGSNYLRKGL